MQSFLLYNTLSKIAILPNSINIFTTLGMSQAAGVRCVVTEPPDSCVLILLFVAQLHCFDDAVLPAWFLSNYPTFSTAFWDHC
jgi:hypothetical protein